MCFAKMIAGHAVKTILCETVKQFEYFKYITFALMSYRIKEVMKDMIFMKANQR